MRVSAAAGRLGALLGLIALHCCSLLDGAAGSGPPVVRQDEPIRIGIATLLSGQEAFLGHEIVEGAEAFVKDRQTILDHPITLLPLDDGCDPASAVERAERFCSMDPRPVAVVGYICSSSAIEAARVHARCGLPVLNVSSSDPLLTEQGSGWVLRLWASHRNQGIPVSRWAQTKAFRQILLLHEGDPASAAIVKGAQEALFKLSPRPHLRVASREESARSAGKLLQAKDPFHLVFYVGEGWDLADLWRGLPKSLLNVPWLLDARAVAAFRPSKDEPQPKDIYSVSFPPPSGDPRRPDFLYFRGRFGEPGYYTLVAYDALAVLADALQRSGRKLGEGTCWEPGAVLKALRETRIEGLTGPISFDVQGDRKDIPVQIRHWKGSRWEPVWEGKSH
jgi:branched-chain amino acid transport system substrate-binding protein